MGTDLDFPVAMTAGDRGVTADVRLRRRTSRGRGHRGVLKTVGTLETPSPEDPLAVAARPAPSTAEVAAAPASAGEPPAGRTVGVYRTDGVKVELTDDSPDAVGGSS